MAITLEDLHRAQRLDRAAIAQVVRESYARIHRMAHGLAGRADVAKGILRFVVGRGLRALPHWRDEGAPARWFQHHTVLAARRAARNVPNLMEDLLVLNADAAEPGYLAFVRSLRSLPVQQREAFLLHHAEHLTLRQTAIAMDCSVEAANTHLAAGSSALKHVSGEDFARFARQVAAAYAKLTPADEVELPAAVESRIGRFVWPRKLWRIVSPILAIALVAGLIWAGWKLYHLIDL